VEVSFIIPTINSSTKTSETLIDDKGNIEYWKTIRCEDCGTDSTHAGVYQAEWIDA
jgi:hypothetical protein